MSHYRVECGTFTTGIFRPADANMHEFDAADDDEAVRTATAYAFSQHEPGTRSRVFRQEFLGWVQVSMFITPCPDVSEGALS